MKDNVNHKGGCHCGRVRFEVEAPAEIEVGECNCSMCTKTAQQHLVVKKAQFRLEQQITVAGNAMPLATEMTTLPPIHDPDNGKWTPRIALAAGTYDAMESILGKVHIGQVVFLSDDFLAAWLAMVTAAVQGHVPASSGGCVVIFHVPTEAVAAELASWCSERDLSFTALPGEAQ